MYYENIADPSWIEIDLKNIAHNMREIRRKVGDNVRILGVIKADAYGHGAEEVALTILKNGADRLGVATMAEGIALRTAGIGAPVMILGYLSPSQVEKAIRYNIIQTVYNYEMAENISQKAIIKNKIAPIHIKIDTGMGRLGFLPIDASVQEILRISKLPGLHLEGLFSHLAFSEASEKSYSYQQCEIFDGFIAKLKEAGLEIPICHMANSTAVIEFPRAYYDMVRPGLAIYGYYTSSDVSRAELDLKPALSVKARISNIKTVPKGSLIGYSCRFCCERESTIVTLQIGYADGINRKLSSGGNVLIHGKRVPVIGNICMDQMMVDVTDIDLPEIGEEAVIIGSQGDEQITADEVAEIVGTINYEILCNFNNRLTRFYIN